MIFILILRLEKILYKTLLNFKKIYISKNIFRIIFITLNKLFLNYKLKKKKWIKQKISFKKNKKI